MSHPKNATIGARIGVESDQQHGAVMPPLYLSSNYAFDSFEKPRRYDYTRSGNPTRNLLGESLCQLEGGSEAVITSSGMSAITLICQLLGPNDLLLAPHDCYGGTFRLFSHLSKKGVFEVSFSDQGNDSIFSTIEILRPKVLWIETPSNPLLRVVDVKALAKVANKVGTIVVVDNTFLSPIFQKPLELGADVVVHSTTKYINGHSDVVGGAVIAKNKKLGEELSWWANCLGLTGAPFDSFLTLRGIRTLDLRVKQQEKSSKEIARFLTEHPLVEKVFYPGLKEDPNHRLASSQQEGFGSIISFELKGGKKNVAQFIEMPNYFSLAESLGGVESLICHPTSMTHLAMEESARIKAGIKEGLIRLSIGLEDPQDLISDLKTSLDQVIGVRPSENAPIFKQGGQIRASY
jgi:cystathionine gamma-synthase